MPRRTKILVLIDGFNYYHKLTKYQENNNVCVKWLDYYSLLIDAVMEHLGTIDVGFEIIFFTAIATHRIEDSQARHKTYIKALEESGVNVVRGEFKNKYLPPCRGCKQKKRNEKILRHEEKRTDVNIAITMLEKAMTDQLDIVYLLSGDNDFVPVVKRVKELCKNKRVIICPPPQKQYFVHNLLNASLEKDFYRIRWSQIKEYQFPDNYKGLSNPWKI